MVAAVNTKMKQEHCCQGWHAPRHGLFRKLLIPHFDLGVLPFPQIRKICNLDGAVRLVITIGYAKEDDKLRPKKRKELNELVSQL